MAEIDILLEGVILEGTQDRARHEVLIDLIRHGFGNRRDAHYYEPQLLQRESARMSAAMSADISKYIVAAWRLHNARKTNKALATLDFAKREKLHDFVGEAILIDAVAEADQRVDLAHQAQRLLQSCNIAVDV